MNNVTEVPNNILKFSGTPADIGFQIWERMCLPAIRLASNNEPPIALQQMYVGFLSAAMGSMAADFGHQSAVDGAQMVVNSFAGMVGELEGLRVQ